MHNLLFVVHGGDADVPEACSGNEEVSDGYGENR